MGRVAIPPRPDWRQIANANGFAFHIADGEPYWDESAYYAFTLRQIEDDLEAPSQELHALCLAFVARATADERILARLAIPQHAWDAVAESWRRSDPSLYGRLDLAYDGRGPAKLLEYNADTPTALYETGVFQWLWLEDSLTWGTLPRGIDQFNSVHDKLVDRFAAIARGHPLHLTSQGDDPEDRGTVAYLEDCARQAGLEACFVPMEAIGIADDGSFVDDHDRPIHRLFKLYPWEWFFQDQFGRAVRGTPTRFLEPPWKAVLSNKGILPFLWEMEPGHPNLLAAYFEDDMRKAELGRSFARKPFYSREGANVLLVRDAQVLERDEGPYGSEGYVRQAFIELPSQDGHRAVVGSWLVGGAAAGICLRESRQRILSNRARFVPHIIQS